MARTKKTRVKSAKRQETMAARWKDPVYAAKMREAAKRGAATANAKRKTNPPPPHHVDGPAGAPPPPPADPPTPPTPPSKASARSYTPGRSYR